MSEAFIALIVLMILVVGMGVIWKGERYGNRED